MLRIPWGAPYPGQFVLGPGAPSGFPEWKSQRITSQLLLSNHPALNVTRVADGERALTLIGVMLDPLAPGASDSEILRRLLPTCVSIRQLTQSTAALGGRWALIAACDDGLFLFHDALGLRQVFHTTCATNGIWAFSQPGLAVSTLELPFDDGAHEFVDSYAFRSSPEYRWPGAGSPLLGLRHLLPNHYLDLHTARVTRYWPDQALSPMSMTDAIDRIAVIMPGLMQAAAARYDLVLAITAGLDSRLVLAAARSIQHRLSYATVRQAKMPNESEDLTLPARLLTGLGLHHQVVRARASMSPEFSWAFKQNVLLAHDHYGADAEAILARFGRYKAAVTGSGAEIGRCSFRKDLPFGKLFGQVTADDLARLQCVHHPYAIGLFDEWLSDVGANSPIHVLDLFEWEQGHGNWLAMAQQEFDTAWQEILTPYNCRALLTTFLSVDEQYRRAPNHTLFRMAAKRLWPEVLNEPINPHHRQSVARRCVGVLRRGWRWAPATL
jgi:hypothetical protein